MAEREPNHHRSRETRDANEAIGSHEDRTSRAPGGNDDHVPTGPAAPTSPRLEGKYTVQEVSDRTGVPAATLRQWERRYGTPRPSRTESGYRLYSENDIDLIAAITRHIGDGVPASRATELAKHDVQAAAPGDTVAGVTAGAAPAHAPVLYRRRLVDAAIRLDETGADRVFSEALAAHNVERVLSEVVAPALVDVGELWHGGRIPTTTEHFASNFVQNRLRSLLRLAATNARGEEVIVACAPGDQHELGPLMLAVLLRRAGHRVYYVGADTPVADLVGMAATLRPRCLMVSASTTGAYERLLDDQILLRRAAPLMVFGGRAFDADPERAASLGGHYLADDVATAVTRFQELLHHHRHASHPTPDPTASDGGAVSPEEATP
jgi:MerR family transcriptional regulator, light-induced transcriptional regulator